MKITEKQKKDLETIIYFIPESMRNIQIKDKDIEKFFEYSDSGKHKQEIASIPTQGSFTWLWALIQGKRWRGIHMEQYEQWILDGSTPIYTLLVDFAKRKWYQFWKPTYIQVVTPDSVVEFMKKELFKGASASSIEYTYNQILWKNSTR